MAMWMGLVLAVVLLQLGAACAEATSGAEHLHLPNLRGSDIYQGQDASSSSACGPQLSIETPSCSVVAQGDGYQLRQYPDGQIWVETLVADAAYAKALIAGFYRCFYYISGKNSREESIEMTAPVLIIPAPEASGWRIGFFAPSRFKSVEDLPPPTDPTVYFNVQNSSIHAVLGPFGGFPDDGDYHAKWLLLRDKLSRDGTSYDETSVVYEGYSSPFEFKDRKQEVHVKVFPAAEVLSM